MTAESGPPARPWRTALSVLAVSAIGAVLVWRWPGIQPVLAVVDRDRLAGLLVIGATLTLLTPTGWYLILRRLGSALSWRSATRIWLLAGTARFVPGAVWPFAARIALAREAGVPTRTASLSLYLETVLTAATSLVAGAPALQLRFPSPWTVVATVAALAGLALLLKPAVVRRALTLLRIDVPVDEALDAAGGRGLAWLATAYVTYWLAWGLIFLGFTNAFHAVPTGDAWLVVSAFALAYCAGFIAPILPAGLGLREGALFVLLSGVLPTETAITVAIGWRFFMLCGELPALLTGLWLGRHAPARS